MNSICNLGLTCTNAQKMWYLGWRRLDAIDVGWGLLYAELYFLTKFGVNRERRIIFNNYTFFYALLNVKHEFNLDQNLKF